MEDSKYFYEVGYHTCEESNYCSLVSDKKVSQKEFEKICIKACITVLQNFVKEGEAEHLGYYEISTKLAHITFQGIFHLVVEELEKNGFKQLTFNANFSPFGWANLFDKKDWKSFKNGLDNRLFNVINLNKKLVKEVAQKLKKESSV